MEDLDRRKEMLYQKYGDDPKKLKKIDSWFEMRSSQIMELANKKETNYIGDGKRLKNVAEKIKKK